MNRASVKVSAIAIGGLALIAGCSSNDSVTPGAGGSVGTTASTASASSSTASAGSGGASATASTASASSSKASAGSGGATSSSTASASSSKASAGSGGATSSSASTGASGGATSGSGGSDTQTPPEGAAALDAWLATGEYKTWQCETAPHANRSPSPHGANRICSNAVIEGTSATSAMWPKGSASVKELYANVTDTKPMGYAVSLKTAPDSGTAGANWYWYEKTGTTVAADGLGVAACTGCHAAAGSDVAHTPSPGGRDFVYTPVANDTPPQGGAALDAWLATGAYKMWKCEAAPHANRSPSPHGANRICSNSVIEGTAAATAMWPMGAASVKELYANVTDATPMGYAVSLKTAADSGTAGANWYWYEKAGATAAADGLGVAACTACHAAAGSDAAHTPSVGGRDLVYTPVP